MLPTRRSFPAQILFNRQRGSQIPTHEMLVVSERFLRPSDTLPRSNIIFRILIFFLWKIKKFRNLFRRHILSFFSFSIKFFVRPPPLYLVLADLFYLYLTLQFFLPHCLAPRLHFSQACRSCFFLHCTKEAKLQHRAEDFLLQTKLSSFSIL